jgi:hypothetical protein
MWRSVFSSKIYSGVSYVAANVDHIVASNSQMTIRRKRGGQRPDVIE